MISRIAIALLLVGIALFVVGLVTPQYHDSKEYERRYRDLTGPTRSKDFHELRQSSLTSSLKLQDYGLTAVSLGILIFLAGRWRMVSAALPRKKITVALLGSIAALATIAAEVGSLYLDMNRGEFPHWADSLGIPLAGMPVLLAALTTWAVLHSFLVEKKLSASLSLTLRHWNWWLALLVAVTFLVLVSSVVFGDFWLILPTTLWIAFYFSIWISRSAEIPTQERSHQPSL